MHVFVWSVLDKPCLARDLDMQINFNFKIQKSKLKRNLWDEKYLLPSAEPNQAKKCPRFRSFFNPWIFCFCCWTELPLVVENANVATCAFALDITCLCGNSYAVPKMSSLQVLATLCYGVDEVSTKVVDWVKAKHPWKAWVRCAFGNVAYAALYNADTKRNKCLIRKISPARGEILDCDCQAVQVGTSLNFEDWDCCVQWSG